MDPQQRLSKNLLASIDAKQQLVSDAGQGRIFLEAVATVVESYKNGGRLYIAGNGGSAADAQHLAAEFVGRLSKERGPLPAEALTVDSSILTAIGNDYGYEHVFARQVRGKMRPVDVFLGITTSGRSQNIVTALQECRSLGAKSIVFTGSGGGHVRALADYCLVAPGVATSTIQEVHIVLAHTLCECVEAEIFPSQRTVGANVT